MTKPERKIRIGNIHATIWNNAREIDGQIKELKNIKLEKVYKDKDGSWKSSNSFYVDELPKAIMALSKAFSELMEKKENKN